MQDRERERAEGGTDGRIIVPRDPVVVLKGLQVLCGYFFLLATLHVFGIWLDGDQQSTTRKQCPN